VAVVKNLWLSPFEDTANAGGKEPALYRSAFDYASVILEGGTPATGFWRLNENGNGTGALVAYNLGVNGGHGLYQGNVSYGGESPTDLNPDTHFPGAVQEMWVSNNQRSSAVAFDFSTLSSVIVTNVSGLIQPTAFSVELWAKPTVSTTAFQVLLNIEGVCNIAIDEDGHWLFEVLVGGTAVSGLGLEIESAAVAPRDSWSHVVGTFSDTNRVLKLYVNATQVGSVQLSGHHFAPSASLYKLEIAPSFGGAVADVATYDSQLDEVDVLGHWQGGGGSRSAYQVKLESQPLADVTVDITPSGHCYSDTLCNVTVSPTSLTFTPQNWNRDQTVQVAAVNDDIDEPPLHAVVLTHAATSGAGACHYAGDGYSSHGQCRKYNRYDSIGIHDVKARVTDDDESGVLSNVANLSLSEGGDAKPYELQLATQPLAAVTLHLSHDLECYRNCSQYDKAEECGGHELLCNSTISPTMLTFTPSNWGLPQTIEVRAIDDDLDEMQYHTTRIVHSTSSADAQYDFVAVDDTVVSIYDNDDSQVMLSKTVLQVAEGEAEDQFDIWLTSEPFADVSIYLHTDGGCYRYCGYPKDDLLDHCGQSTGGKLCNATVSPRLIVFSPADWRTHKTVLVAAVEDQLDEPATHNSTVEFTAISDDLNYNAINVASTNILITDNDTAAIRIWREVSQNGTQVEKPCTADGVCVLSIKEGDNSFKEYKVALSSEPRANVFVTVQDWNVFGYGSHVFHRKGPRPWKMPTITSPCDGYNCDMATVLTFTPQDWFETQTVLVQAVNDDTEEPAVFGEIYHLGEIVHSSSSIDPQYDKFPLPNITNHIEENGNSSVFVSSYAFDIAEGGAGYNITVVLRSEPWKEVYVDFFTDYPRDQNKWAEVICSEESECAKTADKLSTPSMCYRTGATEFDGSCPTCYDLTRDPNCCVQNLNGSLCNVTVIPNQLVFTKKNWMVEQTIQVKAVDDFLDEGETHATKIFAKTKTEDVVYSSYYIPVIDVTITDNDASGVKITTAADQAPGPKSVAVSECTATTGQSCAGTTADYYIQLASEPWADTYVKVIRNLNCYRENTATTAELCNATIAINGDSTTTQMEFKAGAGSNWNVPQRVTVIATDDNLDEYDMHQVDLHHSVICLSTDNCDFKYLAVSDGSLIHAVTVNITDNDQSAVILVRKDSGRSGPFANFNVQVTEASNTADADVSGVSIANVGARIDSAIDSYYFVRLATEPFDESVVVSITVETPTSDLENSWGVSVVGFRQTAVNLKATASDVGITLPANHFTLALTFTNTNWNENQLVTVVAIDDDYDESLSASDVAHLNTTISHAVTSTNDWYYNGIQSRCGDVSDAATSVVTFDASKYNGIKCDPLTLTALVTDNDHAEVLLSTTALTVSESGNVAVVTVKLASQPYQDVTVQISAKDGHCLLASGEPESNYGVACMSDAECAGTCKRGTKVMVSPTILIFVGNIDNNYRMWNLGQNITITAIEDGVVEPQVHVSYVVLNSSSADAKYNYVLFDKDKNHTNEDSLCSVWDSTSTRCVSWQLNTNITDNDAASIIFQYPAKGDNGTNYEYNGLFVSEGYDTGSTAAGVTSQTSNMANYSVVLGTEPWADVTISFTYGPQLVAGVSSIIFTKQNWALPQNISVRAVDDNLDEAKPHLDKITHAVTSSDGDYNNIAAADMPVYIMDNDYATLSYRTASGSGMFVAEGTPTLDGFTDQYFLKLNTEPTASVTVHLWTPRVFLSMITLNETVQPAVNVTRSMWTEQVTITPSVLIFTTANWNTEQEIEVAAVKDGIREGVYNPLMIPPGTDTGNHEATVYHNLTTTDLNYAAPNGTYMRSGSCNDALTVVGGTATHTYNHPDQELSYLRGRSFLGEKKACTALSVAHPTVTDCDPTLSCETSGQYLPLCCETTYCCPQIMPPKIVITITEDDPSPAPVLEKAYFSDTGSEIFVIFNSVTNRGGLQTGGGACSLLFQGTMSNPEFGSSVVLSAVEYALGADEWSSISTGPFNKCTWTSDTTVRITLGAGSTIVPNDLLGIVNGRIKASANAKLTSSGSILVEPPTNPPVPKAIIKGPELVGVCDDLVLDASSSENSGGRKMTFAWSIFTRSNFAQDLVRNNMTDLLDTASAYRAPCVGSVADGLDLACFGTCVNGGCQDNGGAGADVLNAKNGFMIPRDMLQAGAEYVFTLVVSNFLSPTSSVITHNVSKRDYPIPIVSVVGNARREMRRTQGEIFYGDVAPPSCGEADPMFYYWVMLSGDLNLTDPTIGCQTTSVTCIRTSITHYGTTYTPLNTGTASPKNYKVVGTRKLLNVGETYQFMLIAAMATNQAINNTANLEIYIYPDAIRASIKDGDRVVGTDDDLLLDASESLDPDELTYPDGSAVNEEFRWSCLRLNDGTSLYSDDCELGNSLDGTASKLATVRNGTLQAQATYRFTLDYLKGEETAAAGSIYAMRNASTSVIIGPVKFGSPPAVTVQPVKCPCPGEGTATRVDCCPPGEVTVNPTDRIILDGAVVSNSPGGLELMWTQISGDMDSSVILTQDCAGSEVSSEGEVVDSLGCVELSTDINPYTDALKVKEKAGIVSDALALQLAGAETSETNTILGKSLFFTNVANQKLVIKDGVLSAGRSYTFRLYANDRGLKEELPVGWDDIEGTGYAQITISVNAPPSPGTLTVDPNIGVVLESEFELACTEWVDENLPLSYAFGYFQGSLPPDCTVVNGVYDTYLTSYPEACSASGDCNPSCIILDDDPADLAGYIRSFDATTGAVYEEYLPDIKQLGAKTTQNKYTTQLPLGGGVAYTIDILAYIYDSLGAYTQTTSSVTVTEPIDISGALQNASTGIDTTDPNSATATIGAMASLLNKAPDTETSARRRLMIVKLAAQAHGYDDHHEYRRRLGETATRALVAFNEDDPCPGTTGGTAANWELTRCSGHGQVRGEPPGCNWEADDNCECKCVCDAGYTTATCFYTEAEMDEAAAQRGDILYKGTTAMGFAETTPQSVKTGTDMIVALSQNTDEFNTEASTNCSSFQNDQMQGIASAGEAMAFGNAQAMLQSMSQLAGADSANGEKEVKRRRRRRRLARRLSIPDNSTSDEANLAAEMAKTGTQKDTQDKMTSALVATSVAGEAEQVLSTDNKMIAATKVSSATVAKARSLGSCSSGAGNKKKRRRKKRKRKRRLGEADGDDASCSSKFDPGTAFAGLDMDGAQMAATRDVVNPYSWATTLANDDEDFEPMPGLEGEVAEEAYVEPGEVTSNVVGLGFKSADGPIPVQNLSEPILIEIPIEKQPTLDERLYYCPQMDPSKDGEDKYYDIPCIDSELDGHSMRNWESAAYWNIRALDESGSQPVFGSDLDTNLSQSCTFWNESATDGNGWSTNGCILATKNTSRWRTVCQCNHLTEFSSSLAIQSPALPDLTELLDPSNISFGSIMDNPLPLVTLVGLTLFYLVGVFAAHRKDNDDFEKQKEEKIRKMFEIAKEAERKANQQASVLGKAVLSLGDTAAGEIERAKQDNDDIIRAKKEYDAFRDELSGELSPRQRNMSRKKSLQAADMHRAKHGNRLRKGQGELALNTVLPAGGSRLLPLPKGEDESVALAIAGDQGPKKARKHLEVRDQYLEQAQEEQRKRDESRKKWYQRLPKVPDVEISKLKRLHFYLNSVIVCIMCCVMAVGVDMWFGLGYSADELVQLMFGRSIGAALAVLSLIMAVVALLGYYGNIKANASSIVLYGVLVFIALLSQMAVGGVMYRLSVDLDNYPLVDENIREAWIQLKALDKEWAQSEFGCCGYRDMTDVPRLPCPEEAVAGCKSHLGAAAVEVFKPMSIYGTAFMVVLEILLLIATRWLHYGMSRDLDKRKRKGELESMMIKEQVQLRRVWERYSLFLAGLNGVYFLMGIILTTVGLDCLTVGGYTVPEPIQILFGKEWYLGGLLIGIGLTLLLQPLVGRYAIKHKTQKSMTMYMAASTMLFLTQMIAGVFIVSTSEQAKDYPSVDTEIRVQWYKITEDNKDLTQRYFQCCGLNGPDDVPAYGKANLCPANHEDGCLTPILLKTADTMWPIGVLVLALSCLQLVGILVPFFVMPQLQRASKLRANGHAKVFSERPPSTGATKLAENSLVWLNIVFILMGCWGVMIGFDLLYGWEFVAPSVVVQVFRGARYGAGMVALGLFVCCVAWLGIKGTRARSLGHLSLYLLIMLVVFVGQMLIGAALLKSAADFSEGRTSENSKTSQLDSRVGAAIREVFEGMGDVTRDRAQKQFECCGFSNFTDLLPKQGTDYRNVSVIKLNEGCSTNVTIEVSGTCHLPMSTSVVETYRPGCNALERWNTTIDVGPTSCRDAIIERAIAAKVPLGAATLSLSFLQFMAMWLSMFLICRALGLGDSKEDKLGMHIEEFAKDGTKKKKKEALEPLMGVVKWFQAMLIILNSMFMMFALVLIALGLDLATGNGLVTDPTVAMLYGGTLGGFLVVCAMVLLVVCSLGIFATIKRNKLALSLYAIILGMLLVIQLIVVIIVNMVDSLSKDRVVASLLVHWKEFDIAQRVNAQDSFLCCGFKNATHYPAREFIYDPITALRTNMTTLMCPDSQTCTVMGHIEETTGDQLTCMNRLADTFPGCDDPLYDITIGFYEPFAAGSIAVTMLEVASLCFALYLLFKKKHADDDELIEVFHRFSGGFFKFMTTLHREHTLFSLFAQASPNFTRPQRVTVIFIHAMGDLMLAVYFFAMTACDCPYDPVLAKVPDYCDECEEPGIVVIFLVGIITSLILVPITFSFITMFAKSSYRNKFESEKRRKERWKRQRINNRKDMADRYKPKKRKIPLTTKLTILMWCKYYELMDKITDVRMAAFKYVPPDPEGRDENGKVDRKVKEKLDKQVMTRVLRTGVHAQEVLLEQETRNKVREEKTMRRHQSRQTRNQKRLSKYPKWMFSPGAMALYQKVLKYVNTAFFFVGVITSLVALDLVGGFGYTFEGTSSSGGIYELYSRTFGATMMGLGLFCILVTASGVYGGRQVAISGDAKHDQLILTLRKKVLKYGYVYPLFLVLIISLSLAVMMHKVVNDEDFCAKFMVDFIRSVYDSVSEEARIAAHNTYTCCDWDFPLSPSRFQDMVEDKVCPEEAVQGCSTAFKHEIRDMFKAMSLAFFAFTALVFICISFALAIVEHQLKDNSDAQFVYHRGGGAFGLFETELELTESNRLSQKMQQVMRDKKDKEDLDSDMEEEMRFRQLYKEKHETAVQARQAASQRRDDKVAVAEKEASTPRESIVVSYGRKIAEMAKKQLRKMEEEEQAAQEEEEDIMPKVAHKYPWWVLHMNYFIIFVFLGYCYYFSFVFFMNFGKQKSLVCINTFVIGQITQICFSEPLAIFSKAIILPFILGTLSGTQFGRLAEMAIDIGLGGAAGIGAVGFADRMLNQRREDAAKKTQAVFRGVVGRKLARKVKERADQAAEKRRDRRARRAPSKLQGQRVTLFKMASQIAKEKQSEERDKVRSELEHAVAKRGLRAQKSHTRKRRMMPAQVDPGVEGGGSSAPSYVAPTMANLAAGTSQRPHRFERRQKPLGPGSARGDDHFVGRINRRKAPASGTVALSKALKPKRGQGVSKGRGHKNKKANRVGPNSPTVPNAEAFDYEQQQLEQVLQAERAEKEAKRKQRLEQRHTQQTQQVRGPPTNFDQLDR
jgi:hypothetical protein